MAQPDNHRHPNSVQMTILSLVLLFGHVNANSATTPAPSPPMYATTGIQATTSTVRRMQSGVPVFTSKLTEGCSIDECCAPTISGMCSGNTALIDGTPAQPDVDCSRHPYKKHIIPVADRFAKRGRTLEECCQGKCGDWHCHLPNVKKAGVDTLNSWGTGVDPEEQCCAFNCVKRLDPLVPSRLEQTTGRVGNIDRCPG